MIRHEIARLCRENVPHIFFLCLSKRKRAGHGTKEKALRDELPGGAVNSPKTRGPPPRTAMQARRPPAGCADRCSARNCIPALESPPHTGAANRTPPASLSAAAPPSCPGRGFQRGGPQPAPLCRFKGVRGEIEIPPRFSLGGPGGHSLFKREYPLWLLAPETGAALCAKGPFPLPRQELSLCGSSENGGTFMKYPPSPKISLRFPRYGPSGPGGYPPAGGRTPPPSAPHPPA